MADRPPRIIRPDEYNSWALRTGTGLPFHGLILGTVKAHNISKKPVWQRKHSNDNRLGKQRTTWRGP